MTRSQESGENEITEQAKREAMRTGRSPASVLADMLKQAKRDNDKKRLRKIVRAQKYLGQRNKRKRRKS